MRSDGMLQEAEPDRGDTAAKAGYADSELHRRQIEEFVAAVQENRPPAIDGKEGRRTLEVMRALYQSSVAQRDYFAANKEDPYRPMKAIAKQFPPNRVSTFSRSLCRPVQRPNDVLVRVGVSSISGSELNIWRGAYRRPNGNPVEPGRILGYEHAGTVVEAGPAAVAAGFTQGRASPWAAHSPGAGSARRAQWA